MFDGLVILVLVVSGVIGFVRGATRELVAVLSFLVAIAAAVFLLRYSAPLAETMIKTEWVAKSAALLAIFLVVYIAVRLFGGALARRIHETELGSIDRVVGLGFGLVRALALLGVANLIFHAAVPVDQAPPWVTDAKLYPLTEVSAEALRALAPKGALMAGQVGPALQRAVIGSVASPPDEKGDKPDK